MSDFHELETFELDGLTFEASTAYDDCMRAPWTEHDGHGPVREAGRNYAGRIDKAPGERVLWSDRHSGYVYDVREAMAIAKRDGWGAPDAEYNSERKRLGRELTRGETAALAVEYDYEYCRRWLDNQWHWAVLRVELLDAEGEGTGEDEYLGGLEYDPGGANDWILECARELASEIVARVGESQYIERTHGARFERIQIREES